MFIHSYVHESDHRYAPALAHVNIYEVKYEAKTTHINIYFNIYQTKPIFSQYISNSCLQQQLAHKAEKGQILKVGLLR